MIPTCQPWCFALNELEPSEAGTVSAAVAEHGHWCQHSMSYVDAISTSDPSPAVPTARPGEHPTSLGVRVVSPYPMKPPGAGEHTFVGLAPTDFPDDEGALLLLTRGEALHLARLLTRAVDIADGLAPSRYQIESAS